MAKLKTAVIGLGSMGWGAAISLLRAKLPTVGVDIRPEVLAKFEAEGGTTSPSPAEAVKNADIVFIFVVNAAQTEAVLFGENGAVAAARPNTIFALCATMQPNDAIELCERITDAGMRALDLPVSGGAAKALSGEMTLMAAGDPVDFERVAPALDAIATKIFRLGDTPGMGSQVKMINQLLAGVHIAATAEAMTLGAAAGIDLKTLYDVITSCAGTSWMFENRGPHIVNGDYTPHSAVDIFVKDLGIVASEAEALGCTTPLTATSLALFKEASAAGLGREDDAAVAKILAAKGGVSLPNVRQN
ncbi:L-threonate dehydrogenase [Falsihalocynthiibacter sp. S25ZX9]|uniref:L-threonate dehydrogenase n=1 Tax=Falsihalocynthiibacter sp. S25ZX9 TaxID=3240870 RepID=UPI0035109533